MLGNKASMWSALEYDMKLYYIYCIWFSTSYYVRQEAYNVKYHGLADNIIQYHEHIHPKLELEPIALSHAQISVVQHVGSYIRQDLNRKSTVQLEQQAEAWSTQIDLENQLLLK